MKGRAFGVVAVFVAGSLQAAACSSDQRDFGSGKSCDASQSCAEAGATGEPDSPGSNSTGGSSGAGAAGGGAAAGKGGASAGEGGAAEGESGAAAGESGAAGAETCPACVCAAGDQRSCADSGALGSCAAGTQTCGSDGQWGDCSVKAKAKDNCVLGNDDNCNGTANEGCPCNSGAVRTCAAAGALGSCAAGQQACTADGTWGACSIKPAAKDTCTAANDDNCNGTPNEGCTCISGVTRTCAQGGLAGKCASGMETCSGAGTWGACSITPSAADTCVQGNDDNCNGTPNEACSCINGVTPKACGACLDGTQICMDGKANLYGSCSGAVEQPTTYYRDADGDGFGSAATTVTCGPPPAGYTDQTGDCCDDGGDLAQAKTIFPGQPLYFATAATICSVGWNYNCSAGGSIETSPAEVGAGCSPAAVYPTCAADTPRVITAASCGKQVGICGCTGINQGAGGTSCMAVCTGGPVVTCH